MHPALEIRDILIEIFRHLRAPVWKTRRDISLDEGVEEDTGDTNSLYRAALSCRGFTDPALDHLWCDLNGVLRLFHLLPAFKRDELLDLYILDGAIEAADWVRLDFYATKVQNLTYFKVDDIDPSVFSHMSYFRKGKPLFPALRNMDADASCGTSLPLFLSPGLLSIALTLEMGVLDRCPGAWSIIHLLPTATPAIHTLSLQLILSDAALNVIPRMTNLQHLHLSCPTLQTKITYSFFCSLSFLPKLTDLCISRVDIPFPVPTADIPSTPFPALSSLSLNADYLWQVIFLLEVPRMDGIQYLKIGDMSTRSQIIHQATWFSFFHTISRKFSKSLLTLSIEVPETQVEEPLVKDNARIFEPLLKLHGLEEFTFANDTPWPALQDADLVLLAKAWPEMRILELPSRFVQPKVTFYGLESLASFCPHLDQLVLDFDASSCTLPESSELSHHPLRYFKVGKSLINNPIQAAVWLEEIFPNLLTLSCHDALNHESWKLVKTCLPALREVKRKCLQSM